MSASKPVTTQAMQDAFADARCVRWVRTICCRTMGTLWEEYFGDACIHTAKLLASNKKCRLKRWLPSRLRQQHRRERRETLSCAPDIAGHDDPVANAIHREDIARMHAAIVQLPANQRTAVENYILADKTLKEAAAATGLTVGKIQDRHRIAVNTLRAALASMPLLAVAIGIRPARADVITLSTTDGSITIEGTFPNGFAAATDGNLITSANLLQVTGGGYWPGGFVYLPPVAPTNLPELAGSFAVNYGNAAEWTINLQPNDDPRQIVLGQVVDGWDTLAALAAEPQADMLGMLGLPVDADGQPFTTTLMPVPAPATLLLMVPAALLILRRKRSI